MFYALYIFAACLLQLAHGQVSTSSLGNVTQAFSQARVVPDVLPIFNPIDLLDITFTDSTTMQSLNVTPGSLLTMEQTAMEPEFFLTSNASSLMSSQMFVVAMVDPDAPTPQNASVAQFLHLLGGDFSVDSTGLLSNSSAALMDYFSPAPPTGSDPHRYVLAIFNQPTDFDTSAPTFVNASTPRTNFNLTVFATSVGLGDPVAGNYFLVGPGTNSSTSTASITTQTQTMPVSQSNSNSAIVTTQTASTQATTGSTSVSASSTAATTSSGESLKLKDVEIMRMHLCRLMLVMLILQLVVGIV